MGFVQSAATITLDAHLTQKGRELILFGVGDAITKFALGDSDANYTITDAVLSPGHVPDVTGDHVGCLISVADGVSIKTYIDYVPTTVGKYRTVFVDENDNSFINRLVEIDLGNMLAYMKVHDSGATFNSLLESPYLDFYEKIRIEGLANGVVVTKEYDHVVFDLQMVDYFVYNAIMSNAGYLYYNGSEFGKDKLRNYAQNSALEMTFSSLLNIGNTVIGAGKGGIVVSGREYGYYVNTENQTGTFYTTREIEGITSLSIPRDAVISPAARIEYLGTNYIFLPQTVNGSHITYSDTSGAHDHIKRFSGLDYETNQFYLIDLEANIVKSWFNYMNSIGLTTTISGVHRIQFNATVKPHSSSIYTSATAANLKVILKLDSNSSNWDPNGSFINTF